MHDDAIKLIQIFSEKVKGKMHWGKSQSEFWIICRKADVDKATAMLDEFDVGFRIYSKFGVGSYWGVGYGSSTKHAARHAEVALEASTLCVNVVVT